MIIQSSLVALCAQQHRLLCFRSDDNFHFTQKALAAPIGLPELPLIVRHYPVLFMGGTAPIPVAILGLNGKNNAFIDQSGKWAPNHYIPAAIQLHPFTLHELPDQDAGILLFEKTSPRLVYQNVSGLAGRLFQDDGEPTELLRNIANANAQLYEGRRKAVELGSLLRDANILINSNISLNIGQNNDDSANLYALNETAYRRLPANLIEQWFREGWIDAVSFILASQQVWAQWLADLPAARTRTSI